MSEQSMTALLRANEIRSARAQMKRDVNSGKVLVIDVLVDVPQLVATITLYELLKAQHRWGHQRVMRVMRACALTESKRLGDATVRQRRVLREHLT